VRNRRGWQLLGLALLALGCSRGSGDASPAPSSAPLTAPTATPALSPAASVPSPSDAPVLTPEDVEDAAEHRITEQNLESELDRLEREIQAE
jgi:hypothetical protein